MCDIENTVLYGVLMKPYLHVNESIKGTMYSAFIETLGYCCNFNHSYIDSIQLPLVNLTQAEILDVIEKKPHAVALPISIDSAMKFIPDIFVPVIETEGQVWVYRPKNSTQGSIQIFASVGVPLLVGLLILTGYAALILWLLEGLTRVHSRQALTMKEIFNNYWCAFISATTVGYGDLVPRTVIGKIFAMLWILFGICGMSTLTGLVSEMISALIEDSAVKRPIYQEIIAAAKGSLDYQVVIRKGAYVLATESIDDLFAKLANAEVTGFIVDYASYWSITPGWFTLGERFRHGIAIPTTIGFIYNVDNDTLLQCLKRRVFFTQNAIWHKFYWSPDQDAAAVELMQTGEEGNAAVLNAQAKLIGPDVYLYLGIAAGILAILWSAIACAEYLTFLRSSSSTNAQETEMHNGMHIEEPEHANETCVNADEEIWQRNESWLRNGL